MNPRLPAAIDSFFFRRITASGFGLMRVAWALFAGAYLIMQWSDVIFYYTEQGIFPQHLEWVFTRDHHRFTLLHYVTQPVGVFALYLMLLTTMFSMMIGLWPRIMTIASVLLLISFHEKTPLILGGGDTLLRNIGFILMIAPGIHAFSITRLHQQWRHWRDTRTFLPPVTMPIWPWRLMLWQMIVIYTTSTWYKLLGTMWLDGTAVEATFHHPVFARLPMWLNNILIPFLGIGDYLVLVLQASWPLLLIPRWLSERILPLRIAHFPLRRLLMIGGLFFHGGILFMMDAGVFSLAVYTAYLGLLRDEDFDWIKKVLNWKRDEKPSITVIYDGQCGLCLRSIFALQLLDHLGRLTYADFRNATVRNKEAPGLTEATLDKALHVRLPDGGYLNGFDAFRHITRHLPLLWLILPFLYIPGVPLLGRGIYAYIAEHRARCNHEGCGV